MSERESSQDEGAAGQRVENENLLLPHSPEISKERLEMREDVLNRYFGRASRSFRIEGSVERPQAGAEKQLEQATSKSKNRGECCRKNISAFLQNFDMVAKLGPTERKAIKAEDEVDPLASTGTSSYSIARMSAASTIARVSDNNLSGGDLLSSTMASTSTNTSKGMSVSTSHFSSGMAMDAGISTLGIVSAAAAAVDNAASRGLEGAPEHGQQHQQETSSEGWRDFKIGDRCDARDRGWEWTECEVIAVQEQRIRVHFVGWSSEWDTWFEKDSRDLAVLHSRSRRGGDSEITLGNSSSTSSSSGSRRRSYTSCRNKNNNMNTNASPIPTAKARAAAVAGSPATPERLRKPLRKWRLADVTFWIEQHLELPKAISAAFRANSISGDLLSTLEDNDLLNELGIEKRLHRRKILLSLKTLRGVR